MTVYWRGVLTLQGYESPDHRVLANVTVRDLPLTLRIQTEDFGAHDGASPVGTISRVEASTVEAMAAIGFTCPPGAIPIYGEGTFSDSEAGQLAAQWVREKVLRGVSVDPGDYEYVDELVDPATGSVVDIGDVMVAYDKIEAAEASGDHATAVELYDWIDSLYYRTTFTLYQIGATTMCAVPAFGECVIDLYDGPDTVAAIPSIPVPVAATATAASAGERVAAAFRGVSVADASTNVRRNLAALYRPRPTPRQVASMVARPEPETVRQAAGPERMHAAWFKPQEFARLTKFTIGDDGRMSGHLFGWGACHRSFTSHCQSPDFMRADPQFPEFHVGEAALDDGTRIRTGVLTFADLHAGSGAGLSATELTRLMENTGTQLGPVHLYVDEFGLQACGQVFSDVPAAQVARALAGFPSYDARRVSGKWSLFGLHVVNTPGHTVVEEHDGDLRMVASVAPPPALASETPCACGGSTSADGARRAASGAHSGCSCASKLTAEALADLAHLDAAMTVRSRVRV